MTEGNCKARFVTAALKFKATVHIEGEKAYEVLIKELKDISLEFVDDLEGANVPTVLRSIKRKDGHHFQQDLTVRHEQQRFDPYSVQDEGWDAETEELVSDIFKLAGEASEALNTLYKKVAILKTKVRQESFLKVVNAVPIPNTTVTVINRVESEMGLDVDKERIRDHMPRPAFLEAFPLATKLLGALTHYIMRNNLLRVKNKYYISKAKSDFKEGYTVLKRVFSGVKQKGGSFYEKRAAEKRDDEATPAKRQKKQPEPTPEDTEQVDTIDCKYCGKSCKSEERLLKHIGEKHPSEKNIFTCPFCTEPFSRYIGYIDHLSEHQDKVIKCRVCKKVFDTLFQLRKHQKLHINQCPFCPDNFSTEKELVDHVEKSHREVIQEEEKQCSLCEATFGTLDEVKKHFDQVHRRKECNICFMRFSVDHQLLAHRQEAHGITNPGQNVPLRDPSDQTPEPPAPAAEVEQAQPSTSGDPGDRTPRSGDAMEQGDPTVTPKKDREVKGRKEQSEVFNVHCPACNRYVRNLETRRLHIRAYHSKLFRSCHFCKRSYMDPWDYNEHMTNKHFWCEICKGYAGTKEKYDTHCKEKHTPVTSSPKVTSRGDDTEKEPEKEPTEDITDLSQSQVSVSQSQVSDEAATTETDREDRPHKCKHCGKGFKKVPQLTMHINTKHRIHKCTDCDKRFVTEEGRDNHRADVHKHPRFHCQVKKCDVYTHSSEELYRHKRDKHWSKFPFRCCICPYVVKTRDGFASHMERMHNIPKPKEDGKTQFKCGKCVRDFRTISMLVDHTRDHPENIHQCRDCGWRFSALDRLHAHCRSSHDTMQHACDHCGTDFPNNNELYHHVRNDHVKICHICRDSFLSDRQLQEHLDEVHAQTPAKSKEQLIDEEKAKEHEEKQRRKRKRKRKRQDDDDDDDDEDDDSTYYPSQDRGDASSEDPEWRPSKGALKRADREGDQ